MMVNIMLHALLFIVWLILIIKGQIYIYIYIYICIYIYVYVYIYIYLSFYNIPFIIYIYIYIYIYICPFITFSAEINFLWQLNRVWVSIKLYYIYIYIYIYICMYIFFFKVEELYCELNYHNQKIPANTCTWNMETLDNCFDLIRSHQQYILWSLPLKIEPATTECRAETLLLNHQPTSHTSDTKLTSHGNCTAN